MKVLQISDETARSIYKNASADVRTILHDTYGKDFFSEKITDRIKTCKDAFNELNRTFIDEDELRGLGFTEDEINYRYIKIFTEALNEGWEPDWNNKDQRKWFPVFNASSSFVFLFAYSYYSSAFAGGSSRLCFKSEELATYAGKQFLEIYKSFILK